MLHCLSCEIDALGTESVCPLRGGRMLWWGLGVGVRWGTGSWWRIGGEVVLNSSDVAGESFVFGAFHGRAFEEGAILFEREVLPVVPGHGEKGFGGLEGFDVGGARQTIPGAAVATAVAAVEHFAHLVACAVGELLTAIFDGEIGKAFPRVETTLTQALCRAGAEAFGAGAAAIFDGMIVVVGREGEEEFAEEEIASGARDDELGVFAYPSKSRTPCPVALVDGSGVGEHA